MVEARDASRAAHLQACFEKIKDLPFDYGKVGSVLEALAVVDMGARYPAPKYSIRHGVEYQDSTGRTAGEIDLIVWDEEQQRAVRVYEVKLSGNPERAMQTAKEQIKRLKEHVKEGNISRFLDPVDRGRTYTVEQFRNVEKWGYYGCKGMDWEEEYDITREEGDILQAKLLLYKRGG
ncbi:MAG: hypothetical protein HC901_03050 [Bdellovibrionaceae bacterium]|nr:hypothetical protein [Pseudobdellovibrionaceae bacterium]